MNYKSINILLVDDEPQLIKTLKKILELSEFKHIDLAENGKQALELIASKDYDLIITDIAMPENDGLELIMNVRKNDPDIFIIATSGNFVGKEYLETALEFGANKTLLKPFNTGELIELIKDQFDVN